MALFFCLCSRLSAFLSALMADLTVASAALMMGGLLCGWRRRRCICHGPRSRCSTATATFIYGVVEELCVRSMQEQDMR
jgi:hypothetical protein